jgi:hypothetical protein
MIYQGENYNEDRDAYLRDVRTVARGALPVTDRFFDLDKLTASNGRADDVRNASDADYQAARAAYLKGAKR